MKKGCLTGVMIILVLALLGSCLSNTSTPDPTTSSIPDNETTSTIQATETSSTATSTEEQNVFTTEQDTAPATQQDDLSAANTEPHEEMVWIPKTGSKYHQNEWCSNMKNPREVALEYAQKRGYKPCKRCH